MSDLETALKCSICHEIYIEPAVVTCGHMFCKGCINRCTQRQCPLCRKTITCTIGIINGNEIMDKTVSLLPPGAEERRQEAKRSRQPVEAIPPKRRRVQSSASRRRGQPQPAAHTDNLLEVLDPFTPCPGFSFPHPSSLPSSPVLGSLGGPAPNGRRNTPHHETPSTSAAPRPPRPTARRPAPNDRRNTPHLETSSTSAAPRPATPTARRPAPNGRRNTPHLETSSTSAAPRPATPTARRPARTFSSPVLSSLGGLLDDQTLVDVTDPTPPRPTAWRPARHFFFSPVLGSLVGLLDDQTLVDVAVPRPTARRPAPNGRRNTSHLETPSTSAAPPVPVEPAASEDDISYGHQDV